MAEYNGELEYWFLPVLSRVKVGIVSWEELLEDVEGILPNVFALQCAALAAIRPSLAGRWISHLEYIRSIDILRFLVYSVGGGRRTAVERAFDEALHRLYQREFTKRQEILREFLRVKLTMQKLEDQTPSKDSLFARMKELTEDELGFFAADREDFHSLIEALDPLEPIPFVLAVFENDRSEMGPGPAVVTEWLQRRIKATKPSTVLITEAEKHLRGLLDTVTELPDASFTLTTENKLWYRFLQLVMDGYTNVGIHFLSVYSPFLSRHTFDYIHCLPSFGYRAESKEFFTSDGEGVAVENTLPLLSDRGLLDVIVPAKFAFASGGYNRLREHINTEFSVHGLFSLPEGTFRPFTSIRTYWLAIGRYPMGTVRVGRLDEKLCVQDEKQLPRNAFTQAKDWRLELLLADEDVVLKQFKDSAVPKVRLGDLAEVFRGKSVLKKDMRPGDIRVLNIANIDNGVIDYTNMDTIDEQEHKVKRYELFSNDVVLACRGTAMKTAVFERQDQTIIASANLMIIRPKDGVEGEYLHFFLESPAGQAMIKSFQRGSIVMNLNPLDIMGIEIPQLSTEKQKRIAAKYKEEQSVYRNAVAKAERRWEETRNAMYQKLLGGNADGD